MSCVYYQFDDHHKGPLRQRPLRRPSQQMSEFSGSSTAGYAAQQQPFVTVTKKTSTTSSQLMSSRTNLNYSIMRSRGEVSLSAFSFLFSEMVQYCQGRVDSIAGLEKRLEDMGFGIGQKFAEVVAVREKTSRRETRIVNMLQYISNVVWKHLFNKAADNLEKSLENDDEYMIHEHAPITNTFVSVPADMGQLNCAAFLAGMIAGILYNARFEAKVTAHLVQDEGAAERTVFLVKFDAEVMSREKKLG